MTDKLERALRRPMLRDLCGRLNAATNPNAMRSDAGHRRRQAMAHYLREKLDQWFAKGVDYIECGDGMLMPLEAEAKPIKWTGHR